MLCVCLGDSLSSLQKAVEQKETSRQQLREQLDAVERETRAKLLEIDAFNTQLKVNTNKKCNHSSNTGQRPNTSSLNILTADTCCHDSANCASSISFRYD